VAILFTLTDRVALRQVRDQTREKRGGGELVAMIDEVAAEGPTPLEEAAMRENMARLLAALRGRRVAPDRAGADEGCSNAEIAGRIDRTK